MTPFDRLILATGSSALRPADPRRRQEERVTSSARSTTRAHLLERSRPGCKAVVIGGGLLGLEAARGLQVQGCDVTVVHLAQTLMERQLDPTGGMYLARKMENLGVRVLLRQADAGASRQRPSGGSAVRSAAKSSKPIWSSSPPASGPMSNSAAAPASKCGAASSSTTTWRRRTRDIFAVGECTEHRGQVFGLVAPLLEQGKVLAATITGNRGPVFTGAAPAAKLKIMGVDVFSAGQHRRRASPASKWSATKTRRSASTRSCCSRTIGCTA